MILNQIGQWSSTLLDHLRSALIAVGILILGLMAAEVIRYLGILLLHALRWDEWCERAGVAAVLRKFRADTSPSAWTSSAFFWIVLISFFMKALTQLNIAWLAGLGRSYFGMLPAVCKAALILLLAGWAARGVARLVLAVVDHPSAFLTAGLIQAVVLNLALYASLVTLGVERALAQPVALITLAAAAFGVALAWALNRLSLFKSVVSVHETEEDKE